MARCLFHPSILFVLLSLSLQGFAQNTGNDFVPRDSSEVARDSVQADSSASDSALKPIPPSPYPGYRIDTLRFSDVHRHTPLEDPFRPGLGNLALDSYSLIPEVQGSPKIGHRFGLPSNPYGIAPKGPLSFDLRYPVTRLGYSMGSNEEQFFHITHSQNITPRWNATVRYRKLGSPGPYPRQKTNSGDFLFSTHYRAPAGTYQGRIAFQANRSTFQQNGGILDESDFEENLQDNRGAFRVRLDEAQSFANTDEIRIDQALFPGGRDFSDTATGSSSELGVYHRGIARNMRLLYTEEDPVSSPFSQVHFDSTGTMDRQDSRQLEQELGGVLQRKKGREIQSELRLGYRFRLIENGLLDSSEVLRDDAVRLYGSWELGRNSWEGKAAYGMTGYGKGDRILEGEHRYDTEKEGLFDSLALAVSYKEREAAYTETRFRSNHFIWEKDFPKIRSLHGRVRWGEPKEKEGVALSYTQMENAVYFDRSAVPDQSEATLHFVRAHARKDLSWRKWNLDLQGAWQKEWGSDIVRVPEIVAEGELYFQSYFFDQALQGRIGVRATYWSDYNGYAYMPVTRRFFLQDDRRIGDYPFFDAFFHGKVQNILFFVELNHGNAGLMGYRYYGAPNYPLRDLMIRVGFKWDLFN